MCFEPAFPCKIKEHDPSLREVIDIFYSGMTLRDWFAGQAMNGLLSDAESYEHIDKEVSKLAYSIADSMMETRDETNSKKDG